MQMRKMTIGQSTDDAIKQSVAKQPFGMKQYQQLKHGILGVWSNTFNYASKNGNTSFDFPYLLIRKQSAELTEVYQRTYWNCPLAYNQVRRLRNIEVEFHQLEAAFKWLPTPARQEHSNIEEINRIFIAVRIMFAEFKEDRCNDCAARLPLFAAQIEKLINELSNILRDTLQSDRQH